jgi:hypothetical protein
LPTLPLPHQENEGCSSDGMVLGRWPIGVKDDEGAHFAWAAKGGVANWGSCGDGGGCSIIHAKDRGAPAVVLLARRCQKVSDLAVQAANDPDASKTARPVEACSWLQSLHSCRCSRWWQVVNEIGRFTSTFSGQRAASSWTNQGLAK